MAMIDEKIKNLIERFSRFPDWESKYKEMITLGKDLLPLSDEERQDKFKVKGCQSQVWLVPNYQDSKLYFKADSDSVLVKGIISLLVHVYSGEDCKTIMNTKPDFLKEIGLLENLTMNRSNGLMSMIKQIQLYAIAYNSLNK